MACAQDNRFEVKNDNNIEHYVYLQSEMDNIPVKDNLFGDTEVDRSYLNKLLMVRGWSKYTWPELVSTLPADTVKKHQELLFTGVVTHFDKPLKKAVQLLMLPDSSFANFITLNSDNTGNFTFTNADVYSKSDQKLKLIVGGKSDEYFISVTDPYTAVNKVLAKNIDPVIYDEPIIQSTKEFTLTGFEHATNLREVKIKATNDSYTHGFGYNANRCGDYICRFGIFNCQNHPNDPGNRAPKQGEMVSIRGMGLVAYQGCYESPIKPGMLAFTGIYTAKEFYGADYSKINLTEPDYLSTICWKHGIKLSSGKETEVTFYTSDITGKFRIVIQGVTNQDVVYGEDSFIVKKKIP